MATHKINVPQLLYRGLRKPVVSMSVTRGQVIYMDVIGEDIKPSSLQFGRG